MKRICRSGVSGQGPLSVLNHESKPMKLKKNVKKLLKPLSFQYSTTSRNR